MSQEGAETPIDLTFFQIPAILSCIGSGMVIISYLTFKELKCLRYVQFVFYTALNDFIVALLIVMGRPNDKTFFCFAQGISQVANSLSSIFWTVVITYQVWLVVNRETVIKDLTYIHMFCWGVPILAAILPLTTNTYGNFSDGDSLCFIADTPSSPDWTSIFWNIISFYFWIWLSLAASCAMIWNVMIRLKGMAIIPETTRTTLRKLVPYPIAILLCWSVMTIADFYFSGITGKTKSRTWGGIYSVGLVLLTLQGFLFSCIFFVMNPYVRYLWLDFCRVYGVKCLVCCGLLDKKWLLDDAILSRSHFSIQNEPDFISWDQNRGSIADSFMAGLRFSSTAERFTAEERTTDTDLAKIYSKSNPPYQTEQEKGITLVNIQRNDLKISVKNPILRSVYKDEANLEEGENLEDIK